MYNLMTTQKKYLWSNYKKQIPELLISMYERSIQNLTDEQSIIFAKFLISYEDLLSKNDFDIGVFMVI